METETKQTPREYQDQLFKKIIAMGLGCGEDDDHFYYHSGRTHRSKSRELPIASAGLISGNVSIENLSDNYHFFFLAVQVKRAIPAPLLRPLAPHFGNIPLSGHVKEPEFMVTNFEKAYHNLERMSRFAMQFSNPLQVVAALRYLSEIQRRPINTIMDMIFYNTRYGCIDRVDFNAVESNSAVMKRLKLDPGDGYCHHAVENKHEMFSEMEVDIYDLTRGGSSLNFTTVDPLPPLGLAGKMYVLPTPEQEAAGIGGAEYNKSDNRILVNCLTRLKDDPERMLKIEQRRRIHGVYQRVPLSTRKFTLNFTNPLDTILEGFYLNHCLPEALPILEV